MEYRPLGNTGLKVSQLCFGALTIGPLQRDLSPVQGGHLIRVALEQGINFIDTAELYGTYPHIRQGLKGWNHPVIIATKSYAYTKEAMEHSIEQARAGMGLDVIPIFLLHEQESEHTLRGHWPALEALLEAKVKGRIQGVGISTHNVGAVQAANKIPEIEVVSPLINITGIGIQGGTKEQMLAAIKAAANLGKGIYAMKPLGGGHLIPSWQTALDFLLNNQDITSVAIGMKNQEELSSNIAYFSGQSKQNTASLTERFLHVESWCQGCGKCVQACPSQAMIIKKGKAQNIPEQCVFCGYCGAACQEFAIKVI